MSVDVPMLLV